MDLLCPKDGAPLVPDAASLPSIACDTFRGSEAWRLAGVLAVATAAAALETLSVAAILPFMAAVMDPSALARYPGLAAFAAAFGLESHREVVVALGLATAGLLALGNAAGALSLVAQERFTARTRARLAAEIFSTYLAQPYAFHVQRDAASLLKVVLGDVNAVSAGVLNPLLAAVSRAFVAIGMMALLLLHDPRVALTLVPVLAVAYFAIYRLAGNRQRRLGVDFDRHNLDRHRISQEGLGAVKELMVLGRARHAVDRFARAAAGAAFADASQRVTAQLPRFVLEPIAFGAILLATLWLLVRDGDTAQAVVPALALYAFAAYRLLPALQGIVSSVLTLRFHLPVLRGLHHDLLLAKSAAAAAPLEEAQELPRGGEIRLAGVSFTYPARETASLQAIDLAIRPKESIGLVGRSGAGKSTLADLILGIYAPTTGSLDVAGVPLHGAALRTWWNRVGFVPQQVFLANASVAENIALGLPPERIDLEAVRRAARAAQIDEFVRALPQGLDTLVGERGVKLSGGQRQRIGVARALYGDPEVLVFDEATNALDGLTEEALMHELRALRGERTLIVIAHRVRTVEACDRIVMLEHGRIVADGAYAELLEASPEFRRFVGLREAELSASRPSTLPP